MEANSGSRVQRLSRAAFDAVKDKGVAECALAVFEDDLQGEQVDDKVKTRINNAVFAAYTEFMNPQLSEADLDEAAKAAIAKLRKIQSETADRETNLKPAC
ncbi:hypothetical protein P3T76_006341 [Phytophthora citrophthora]|uniref:Uncharacterized protein n=1 Tax=Phytophthora citrophthora TaxID=4793 RepID=A0AAD9GP68_9STRA|nr:hypothetical protein P3T76_006341 [Phytophthora citrophthora]